jgi:hypothetical protein
MIKSCIKEHIVHDHSKGSFEEAPLHKLQHFFHTVLSRLSLPKHHLRAKTGIWRECVDPEKKKKKKEESKTTNPNTFAFVCFSHFLVSCFFSQFN